MLRHSPSFSSSPSDTRRRNTFEGVDTNSDGVYCGSLRFFPPFSHAISGSETPLYSEKRPSFDVEEEMMDQTAGAQASFLSTTGMRSRWTVGNDSDVALEWSDHDIPPLPSRTWSTHVLLHPDACLEEDLKGPGATDRSESLKDVVPQGREKASPVRHRDSVHAVTKRKALQSTRSTTKAKSTPTPITGHHFSRRAEASEVLTSFTMEDCNFCPMIQETESAHLISSSLVLQDVVSSTHGTSTVSYPRRRGSTGARSVSTNGVEWEKLSMIDVVLATPEPEDEQEEHDSECRQQHQSTVSELCGNNSPRRGSTCCRGRMGKSPKEVSLISSTPVDDIRHRDYDDDNENVECNFNLVEVEEEQLVASPVIPEASVSAHDGYTCPISSLHYPKSEFDSEGDFCLNEKESQCEQQQDNPLSTLVKATTTEEDGLYRLSGRETQPYFSHSSARCSLVYCDSCDKEEDKKLWCFATAPSFDSLNEMLPSYDLSGPMAHGKKTVFSAEIPSPPSLKEWMTHSKDSTQQTQQTVEAVKSEGHLQEGPGDQWSPLNNDTAYPSTAALEKKKTVDLHPPRTLVLYDHDGFASLQSSNHQLEQCESARSVQSMMSWSKHVIDQRFSASSSLETPEDTIVFCSHTATAPGPVLNSRNVDDFIGFYST